MICSVLARLGVSPGPDDFHVWALSSAPHVSRGVRINEGTQRLLLGPFPIAQYPATFLST